MPRPFPKCPGVAFSPTLPMKGSGQARHNLTSYWTQEQGIIHEISPTEEDEGNENGHSNPEFMKTLNDQRLTSYVQIAADTALCIQEMWMESIGFFPLDREALETSKPTIRVFYRAILNSSGTASALSHLHNLVKQEVSNHFCKSTRLHINSQLFVR